MSDVDDVVSMNRCDFVLVLKLDGIAEYFLLFLPLFVGFLLFLPHLIRSFAYIIKLYIHVAYSSLSHTIFFTI